MLAVVAACVVVVLRNLHAADRTAALLNASYSATDDLYRDLNAAFSAHRATEGAAPVVVHQTHGGSSRQSRAIAEGMAADVATLAFFTDIDGLRKRGLVADGWAERLPNHSVPYTSTVVFVVRKGNPRHIHDFGDLVSPEVTVVTPNPRTSGNGKLAFLAAWGSILYRGGTSEEARAFVSSLYRHVVSLDPGAREASVRFVDEKVGDVLLTWESEAAQDVAEAKGELEIVYPIASIRAEPCVAWIDANARRHGTEALAKSYLEFLFTEPAQEIIAMHHLRPVSFAARERHQADLPRIELFPITLLASSWEEAQRRFFDDDGVFEAIAAGGR